MGEGEDKDKVGTELEEGENKRVGGRIHQLGGGSRSPQASWLLLGHLRPRSFPALGCWAVGPHTSGLTSLCPHLSKWVAVSDSWLFSCEEKGRSCPMGGRQRDS